MRKIIAALMLVVVAGCGNDGGDSSPVSSTIGGSITGLAVPGLVLTDGADSVRPASGDIGFRFSKPRAEGASYNVVVQAQPPGATCSVQDGTGTMGAQDVSNISVICSPLLYAVRGSVSGLQGTGLVLANGSDSVELGAGAAEFSLPSVPNGSVYNVTIRAQPAGQGCSLDSASGKVDLQDILSVKVTCRARMLYVASSNNDAVYQFPIDAWGIPLATNAVTISSTSPTKRLLFSPNGNHLYAVAAEARVIDLYNIGADGKLSHGAPFGFDTGRNANDIVISPDGRYAYVSTSDSVAAGHIWMYGIGPDGRLNNMRPESVSTSNGLVGLAMASDGRRLYAVGGNESYDGSVISTFIVGVDGLLTPLPDSTVRTGKNPQSVVTSRDGRFAYSVNSSDDTIRAFEVKENGSLSRLYVADVSTRGDSPTDIVFSADGKFAYVPNSLSDSIAQYSVGNDGALTPLSPATVRSGGDGPVTVAVGVDGGNLYVGNLGSNSIAAFKINTDGTLSDGPIAVIGSVRSPQHIVAR